MKKVLLGKDVMVGRDEIIKNESGRMVGYVLEKDGRYEAWKRTTEDLPHRTKHFRLRDTYDTFEEARRKILERN